MKARWAMIAVAAALGLAACDTDEFGTVGTGLPTDVSQDSLLVEAPDLAVVEVDVVVPDSENEIRDRTWMFLGNRTRGGFRATPVFRFDFSAETLRNELRDALFEQEFTAEEVDAIVDTLAVDDRTVTAAALDLEFFRRSVEDANSGNPQKLLRDVRLSTASRPVVDTDDSLSSVAGLIGDTLYEGALTDQAVTGVQIDIPLVDVLGWIGAGTQDGLVLYDLAPGDETYPTPNESNLVTFAGQDFTQFGYLATQQAGETVEPEILLTLALPGLGLDENDQPTDLQVIVAAPVALDFTVFETGPVPAGDIVVASYLSRRSWIRVDLSTDLVPPTATINQAVLELDVRQDFTLSTPFEESAGDIEERAGLVSMEVFEALRADATRDNPLSSIPSEDLFALDRVDFVNVAVGELDSTLTLDVTNYVQRAVNSIVDPAEFGLLLRLFTEETDIERLVFHGPTSSDVSLRPRVRVTYTPPADSWR